MKLVQDGVVVALSKLIGVENVQAHRLVSGCLANLTTTRDVTWELLQANGHQVSVRTKSMHRGGNRLRQNVSGGGWWVICSRHISAREKMNRWLYK